MCTYINITPIIIYLYNLIMMIWICTYKAIYFKIVAIVGDPGRTIVDIIFRLNPSYFNFTQNCLDHKVSDKSLYPTFARTSPPGTQITKSIISLLQHYHWSKFTLVVAKTEKWQNVASKVR